MCLLCSTLAWVEKTNKEQIQNDNDTSTDDDEMTRFLGKLKSNRRLKVIYASRTHAQLTQGELKFRMVFIPFESFEPLLDIQTAYSNLIPTFTFIFAAMNELKRTEYNHMKTAIVASRDQLCIRSKLADKSNADKIHLCRSLVKRKKCSFHENFLEKMSESNFEVPILDIENLGRLGLEHQCCPYYVSKEIIKTADIIFMPYNYLIDPHIRRVTQINLRDAIVILDEAHNVEKVCEESFCTSITSTNTRIAIRDMKYVSLVSKL